MSFPLATTTITTSTNANFHRLMKPSPSITPATFTRKRVPYTSCKQQEEQGNVAKDEGSGIDRRNVLVGLSGLYGATATFGDMAVGAPIQPPDLSKCNLAKDDQFPEPNSVRQVECCPPYTFDYSSVDITPFKLPDQSEPLRIRQPSHKLDSENLAKFKFAIAKMKALPKDDPWSFYQQAQIHCAYCNGAYDQVGSPKETLLQVHFNWLFLPWHRYYLYFWEKILGKLIGDPTLSIPFWNWDTVAGMNIPRIYLDQSSPLYNDKRNYDHYSALINYKYNLGDPNPTPAEELKIIQENLNYINNTVFSEDNLKSPADFMGKSYAVGQASNIGDSGALEKLHNVFHEWVGPVAKPNWDMGNFHTAARDTLFWAHHGNVDRMWAIYRSRRCDKVEFNKDDWLNASFVFYDENRQIVKCKVSDCLDTYKLRYIYQPEPIPWCEPRRTYLKKKKVAMKRRAGDGISLIPVSEFGTKPRRLDSTIRALVKRPKPSLTKDDKDEVTEILIVDDIKFDHTNHARFDVYISKPTEGLATPDLGELAGSFIYLPVHHGKSDVKMSMSFAITSLVDDLEAGSSDSLVVSLVPGSGDVTIGGLSIELNQIDDD